MEGQIFSYKNFTGYPASENGGDNTYDDIGDGPSYDPINAYPMAQNGFNLASHANNHAWDYELAGVEATYKYLNDAGFAVRQAVFQQRNKKRIALVAAAGTHTPESVAGPGGGDRQDRPRPGVSVLRATAVTRVQSAEFEAIKKVAIAQGQDITAGTTDITLYTGQIPMAWSNWRLSKTPGLDWDINPDDYAGIVASVREAKKSTDATVFSLHAHESDSGFDDWYNPIPLEATVPASYTRNISHAVIDAGADIVFIHGPHHLRGIQIYKGRPIFYSLSSLTYSLGLHFRGVDLPIEWDDSIAALANFENGKLSKVALHPIVHSQLTNDTSDPQSQLPKLAPKPEAQRILEYLRRVSKPFGTKIDIDNDVGYIKFDY
ncbi:hypothetical protein LCI18_014811 [Fusarium solani-melongenae]|uniref:Uncharacterized protein n=1 Tax=Fusarium solani subsp. cucurbitae TaxID=2747967 RepID=A0ACD3ZS15_FUSSC|nr:hypothetical protein LCI18_014811 [Fusarium solani-melongenae]